MIILGLIFAAVWLFPAFLVLFVFSFILISIALESVK